LPPGWPADHADYVGNASVRPVASVQCRGSGRGRKTCVSANCGGQRVRSDSARCRPNCFFFVDWQINGAAGNVAVCERELLDGPVSCTANEPMAAGSFSSHCGKGWAVTAGTHKFQWALNYDNSAAETNPNNNSAAYTFTPRDSTPDLDVTALRAHLQTAPG